MVKLTRSDITDRLTAMLTEMVGERPHNIESRLQADLGFDSLDNVDLVMQIEEEFGIEVPDADWEDGPDRTVGQVVELIATKLEASGRA